MLPVWRKFFERLADFPKAFKKNQKEKWITKQPRDKNVVSSGSKKILQTSHRYFTQIFKRWIPGEPERNLLGKKRFLFEERKVAGQWHKSFTTNPEKKTCHFRIEVTRHKKWIKIIHWCIKLHTRFPTGPKKNKKHTFWDNCWRRSNTLIIKKTGQRNGWYSESDLSMKPKLVTQSSNKKRLLALGI